MRHAATCELCPATPADGHTILRLVGKRVLCESCARTKVPWALMADAVAWRASTGRWVPLAQNQALVRELGAVAVRVEQ